MKIALVLALLAASPVAADIDYQALAGECRRYAADPQITAALAQDLQAAYLIESLTRETQKTLAAAADLRSGAAATRKHEGIRQLMLLTNDPVMVAAAGASPRVSAEAMEAEAIRLDEVARGQVVQLVSYYRAIQTAIARDGGTR